MVKLPILNDMGYYEMRLESIGGFGANLCGKLLGEIGAMSLGLNAAAFSSYGSEKRGSPVKSFIRICDSDRELRINSPVEEPHLLALFHDRMVHNSSAVKGINEKTTVIINTADKDIPLYCERLFTIDCEKIAMETKSRINMIMLGAIIKASGFIPLAAAEDMVLKTLGKKYPDVLKQNLDGLREGFSKIVEKIPAKNSDKIKDTGKVKRVFWGYKTAPAGGVNYLIGSTAANDLSASREGYFPLFHPEKCIHCGLCDTTCPDMVFRFEEGEYKGRNVMKNQGLDYHYCKGCLRCVKVCPTAALTAEIERDFKEKTYFIRTKGLIAEGIDYKAEGSSGYVTSEAYLDEQRVDGGLL
ncbi:MAG: 2-oxoacid:acceptor oxidoreductase family protein [Clostridia bacterium]|nr:2-oxoacid:acceptor oxidoreductase family protein [Clostridia bacterium]